MVEYDTPMKGQGYIQECKEQIQEDIIAFIDSVGTAESSDEYRKNVLCQIVVDNFKHLEK